MLQNVEGYSKVEFDVFYKKIKKNNIDLLNLQHELKVISDNKLAVKFWYDKYYTERVFNFSEVIKLFDNYHIY